jgi:lipopolysaccharide transport system ATP-binding protein
MALAIKVESLSKLYRLGELGRRSFLHDWKNKLLRIADPDDAPGNFWALRDLSFDIEQGQVVAVIGHNGAGKSTLLKILSSITTPTRGSVKLRGRVAALLEVGAGFHNELTGRDNVFLKGAIHGMSTREVARKFDDIVSFSEVGEFIDTPVKRYSSGMRVRLAFAVAAFLEPEILIVDEVLAVGDAAFQQRCVGKIGEVSRSGRTVLFVSHSAAAVENLCTRGIVLHHGRMDFDGTQTEALRHYAARFTTADGDLRARTDRSGSGEVRITEIALRLADGRAASAITAGEPLEIRLSYENHKPGDFPRLCVEINVTTHLGAPVFCHSNWFTGEQFGPLPARGTIICRLDGLNIPGGAYKLDYGLFPTQRRRAPIDLLKNAADIQVLDNDFFGGGKMPTITDGPCLLRGQWSASTEA